MTDSVAFNSLYSMVMTTDGFKPLSVISMDLRG